MGNDWADGMTRYDLDEMRVWACECCAVAEKLSDLISHMDRLVEFSDLISGMVRLAELPQRISDIRALEEMHHYREWCASLIAMYESLIAAYKVCSRMGQYLEQLDERAASSFDRESIIPEATSILSYPKDKLNSALDAVLNEDKSLEAAPNMPPVAPASVENQQVAVEISKVNFSAIAPKQLTRGGYSILNVVMYDDSSRNVVDELIATSTKPVFEQRVSVANAPKGASVCVVLASPHIPIVDDEEEYVWQGGHQFFNFAVELPREYGRREVLFVATVYINGVIATKLNFAARCTADSRQELDIARNDVCSAFVSYASKDRNLVTMVVQGMKKARPDLDVFFDVDTLRSGQDWQRVIYQEIESRDVLFLCWSLNARISQHVETEWRHAYDTKGISGIEPVPIDPPDVCPPPAELNSLHFNDRLLYLR